MSIEARQYTQQVVSDIVTLATQFSSLLGGATPPGLEAKLTEFVVLSAYEGIVDGYSRVKKVGGNSMGVGQEAR